MPSTNSVKFDTSNCTLREQSDEHLGWSAENDIYFVLRVPKQRTNWSFDIQDVDAANDFFSKQSAANGGVLLEMESVEVAGQTALRGLFKYRSPIPQSLGMMFVNILWIPCGDCTAQLNVESLELGETGSREAAVSLIENDRQSRPEPSEPVLVSSMEEMFAHMRAQPLRVLASDDRKYDQSFPEHPLSKVRHRMAQVMRTITISIDEAVPSQQKTPSRWWKFW